MQAHRIVFTGMMMFLLFTSAALAGDFDWLQDLSRKCGRKERRKFIKD